MGVDVFLNTTATSQTAFRLHISMRVAVVLACYGWQASYGF